MRVTHDLALLDSTVLAEKASNLILGQAGVNAGNKQVGARVDSTVIVPVARLLFGSDTVVHIMLGKVDRGENAADRVAGESQY